MSISTPQVSVGAIEADDCESRIRKLSHYRTLIRNLKSDRSNLLINLNQAVFHYSKIKGFVLDSTDAERVDNAINDIKNILHELLMNECGSMDLNFFRQLIRISRSLGVYSSSYFEQRKRILAVMASVE